MQPSDYPALTACHRPHGQWALPHAASPPAACRSAARPSPRPPPTAASHPLTPRLPPTVVLVTAAGHPSNPSPDVILTSGEPRTLLPPPTRSQVSDSLPPAITGSRSYTLSFAMAGAPHDVPSFSLA